MSHISPALKRLASAGVHFAGAQDMLTADIAATLANDAEPAIVTTPSGGIPTYLNTYVDPKLIEVLFAPVRIAQIVGEEVQKGDWVTPTAVFPMIEATGEVSSYGDFNTNGSTGANITFPQRQQYLYQTMVIYGDRQADQAGLARVNWANTLKTSAINVLNRYQNTTYALGVAGLDNYGLLNDPSLPAALSPTSETINGSAVTTWAAKDAAGIYADIVSMWDQMQVQMQGLVTREDKLVLAMAPQVEANLTKTNQYNVNVTDQIKKNFPNMRIETAVQYATQSGNLVQMIAEEVEGQRTAQCGYSEKLRAHAVVRETSSYHQKMSQGTWGTIIFRPLAIVQMLGV